MRRWFIGVLVLALGCTGQLQPLGVTEPIRVRGGAFHPGAWPSSDGAPVVTALEVASGVVLEGQLARRIAGRVSDDAYAVIVALDGLGSGWWIHPVDALDPTFPGERSFELDVDVGSGIPPGRHVLRVAAVDDVGRTGPVTELTVCVIDDAVPDGLNACDPALPPPAAVITLTWDTAVDLNLVVDTPDGKRVDARHPTTALVELGATIPPEVLADPHVGRLNRDSNAGCIIDGRNAESLVFLEDPPEGTYLLYADLFDACGEAGARFAITVYRRRGRPDGTYALEQTEQRTGFLPAAASSGGALPPLYLGAAVFPD